MKNKLKIEQIKSFDIVKHFRKLMIVIIVGLLGNIVFSLLTSNHDILSSLIHFSYNYLILAIILTLIPWFTHVIRILVWTNFLGKNISIKNLFKIVLSTEIGAAISPTILGGAPVKIGMLMHNGLNSGTAASLTLLGSIEEWVFFIVVMPIAFTLSSSWNVLFSKEILSSIIIPVKWFALFASILSILIFLFAIVKKRICHEKNTKICNNKYFFKFKQKFKDFYIDFKIVFCLIKKNGKGRFLLNLFLTSFQWVCRYSVIFALINSLGFEVSIIKSITLQWVVFALMTLIPTPGASAGAEAIFYLIYRSLIPEEFIGIITMGWRFFTFHLLIILGIIILIILNFPKHVKRKYIRRPDVQPVTHSITRHYLN